MILTKFEIFASVSSDELAVANEKLPVPVSHIRMDYPFNPKEGDFEVFKIDEATDVHSLISAIRKVMKDEYSAGHCTAPHSVEDYVIELVEIHPNNLATVYIGS